MYRIIADENIDHRIVHRLRHYDHDIEHVEHVPELGKSTTDDVIAAHSLDTDRLILTNDDDFLREFDASAYHGVLFIEDETLTSERISDIVLIIEISFENRGTSQPSSWRSSLVVSRV